MVSSAFSEAEARPWVLVAGTGEDGLPRDQELAGEAVGRALAQRGFGLITCGWLGVDKAVTQAYAAALQAMGTPLSRFLKQIVPRPDQPAFFGGDVLYVEKGPQEWVESVRRARAVILIGGLGGTFETYRTARMEQVPVFPLAATGGDAARAHAELLAGLEGQQRLYRRLRRDDLASLDAPATSPAEAADLAERAVGLIAAELGEVTAADARPGREEREERAASSAGPARPGRAPSSASAREKVDFLIVTALPEERDAVLRKLGAYRKVPPSKNDVHVYFRADVEVRGGGGGAYRVAVLPLLGMGRVNAATATSDAIKRWRPGYVLLVGIAGGVEERRVALGDLLISEQVVDFELQKITERGAEVRWSVHKASRRLYAAALNLLDDGWRAAIDEPRPDASPLKIHVGPVASGDKVVAVDRVLREYRSVWPALIGVEMEAAGVASACFASARRPEFFMIRGVSDLADAAKGSAAVDAWRAYACDVAAAYAVELLRSGPVLAARPAAPSAPRNGGASSRRGA